MYRVVKEEFDRVVDIGFDCGVIINSLGLLSRAIVVGPSVWTRPYNPVRALTHIAESGVLNCPLVLSTYREWLKN